MKKNDKVRWIDPVSGATKRGVLIGKTIVVSEAICDEDGYPSNFKDVNKETWDINGEDGKKYIFEEKDLELDITNHD